MLKRDGVWTVVGQGTMYYMRAWIPRGKGQFYGEAAPAMLPFVSYFDHLFVKVTSEPLSTVNEEQLYRRPQRRRQSSAALSTPPAVHVHIGSDGPTSNGSISSRGIGASMQHVSRALS